MQKKAHIIAFSGIDGCGKSTQLNLVYNYLIPNYKVYISKLKYMPLDEMNKNKIKDLLIESKSYIAILKNYLELETTKIKEYDYILCDRYLMCYLAYAYAYGIKDIDALRKLLFFIKNPDLTLYFDIDVDTSIDRIKSRGKKINNHENYSTLYKAKEGYEKLFHSVGDIAIINASGKVEDTSNQVKNILLEKKLVPRR